MYIGMILTLIVGLFFLIGIVVLKSAKNKHKLAIFTTSLAFVVILGLLFMELLPELIETKNIYLVVPVLIGFILLIILDKLIPNHHHEHSDKLCDEKDHDLHLNHIGIITIIAISIHNIIEGISLYTVTLNSIKSGIFLAIGISLHNIPLGFQIGNVINNKKSNKLFIILLCISSFLGSLIIVSFGGLSETIINVLLSLTVGMLLYILIFELFNELRKYLGKRETLYGIIIGIIVLFVTHVF